MTQQETNNVNESLKSEIAHLNALALDAIGRSHKEIKMLNPNSQFLQVLTNVYEKTIYARETLLKMVGGAEQELARHDQHERARATQAAMQTVVDASLASFNGPYN